MEKKKCTISAWGMVQSPSTKAVQRNLPCGLLKFRRLFLKAGHTVISQGRFDAHKPELTDKQFLPLISMALLL